MTSFSEKPNSFSSQSKETLSIDPKRLFFQSVRYWYLIVLSVMIGVGGAFLFNRYSTKIYSVSASIIIKESEEVSGGELLYNNPLVKFYRNYLNETYIIKSIPLIERTVSQLQFEGAFYRVGNFITTESYRSLPFEVVIRRNEKSHNLTFSFHLLDDNKYQIHYMTEEGELTEEHKFGEEVNVNDVLFELNLSGELSTEIKSDNFIFSYQSAQDVAKRYVARLSADWAEEGAGVINLFIKGSNPKKEIDFLNGLIKNYQDYDLEKKNEAAKKAIGFIDEQLKNISDSLKAAERQLENFKNKNIVTDLNSEALRLYEKMEGLELQKTDLVVHGSYYDYLEKYIKQEGSLDQVILPTSVGISDPILVNLVSDMMKYQTDIKLLNRPNKLENPLISESRKRMDELKREILESMKSQKSIDKIKLDFLNKSIDEIERQLSYLPVAERQFVNIKRNYALLENLYVFLLQKQAEAGISKASNTTDMVVVNPPIASGPISPSPSKNYLLGLSLGVTLPFLFFVLLEVSNTKIQSKEDIDKITTIPFIGGVGHKKNGQSNVEVFANPKSAISESFRAIRSSLYYFLSGKEKGVFLITSSISGEGKTFSSVNMASVFALSGKKTLIVGADMRKPKIFGDFNLPNDVGLSNYLAGLSEFSEVVKQTSYDNLYLVSGGPVPPNPSELMLNKRMENFLDIAKQHFDFILVDSPPLALVSDAFLLSRIVDHTIFITRQNYTPKGLLKTINEFYVDGKISNISIVLNDIKKSGPGYGYGYGYSYGYGYGYGYGVKKEGNGYYES